MSEEKIKLPRSSYEELCKIIKAYGRLTKPASLDEVATLSGIGKTVISANNSFLSAIGLLEGGKAKIATEPCRELSQALEHELIEAISVTWRKVIENTDFLNKMVLAVKIRKGMEISSLESHIAYSAGEPKSKAVMTGSRTVIDILKASSLIQEKDDKIIPVIAISSSDITTKPSDALPIAESSQKVQQTSAIAANVPSTTINLNIDVRINAELSELDELGEKLTKLLKSFPKLDKDNNKV